MRETEKTKMSVKSARAPDKSQSIVAMMMSDSDDDESKWETRGICFLTRSLINQDPSAGRAAAPNEVIIYSRPFKKKKRETKK